MLKATSRQIKTYNERYGNFRDDSRSLNATDTVAYTDNADSVSYSGYDTAHGSEYDNNILITDRSAVKEPKFTPLEELNDQEPMYSTYNSVSAAPQVNTELPKRPVKERKARESEDFMPSIKTQAYAKDKAVNSKTEKPDAAYRESSKLTPRMKMLLLVYIAIAFVLAIAVIATGVSISSASAQAQSYADEIVQKQEFIAEQESKIALLTDETTIRDSATAVGMVYSGNAAYTASYVEKVEYPTPEPHTNGFDKFCDGLSRL